MKKNNTIQKHILLIAVVAFLALAAVQAHAQHYNPFDTFRTSEIADEEMAGRRIRSINGIRANGYYWNG